MGKYKVKDARFAVHLQKVEGREDPRTGKILKHITEQSYYAGSPFELSDEDAIAHIHKIEPIDDSAKALFKRFHDEQDRKWAARSNPTADLVETISAAVIKRLAEEGHLKNPTLVLSRLDKAHTNG